MKTQVSYFYEEKTNGTRGGWISAFYKYGWTLEECKTAVMQRKIVSPKSVLRIVRETRETWEWRERSKVK